MGSIGGKVNGSTRTSPLKHSLHHLLKHARHQIRAAGTNTEFDHLLPCSDLQTLQLWDTASCTVLEGIHHRIFPPKTAANSPPAFPLERREATNCHSAASLSTSRKQPTTATSPWMPPLTYRGWTHSSWPCLRIALFGPYDAVYINGATTNLPATTTNRRCLTADLLCHSCPSMRVMGGRMQPEPEPDAATAHSLLSQLRLERTALGPGMT